MPARKHNSMRAASSRPASTGTTSLRPGTPRPVPRPANIKTARSQLSLSLQYAKGISAEKIPLSPSRIRRLVSASLTKECAGARITVRFVGNQESQALNNAYRKRNTPTNVLTFDYAHPPRLEADVVISLPCARTEARAQGKTLASHLAHLLVHGVLHACGLDHHRKREAQAMESIEIGILKRFRISDPYEIPETRRSMAQ